MLTPEEKAALLALAWRSVRHAVTGEGPPPAPPPLTAGVCVRRGAFVTLRAAGDLRGCLGIVQPVKPLWEAVRDMALAVPREDPRFDPVAPAELPTLTLEVSAMTPLEPVRDISTIQVGVHGLYVRRGTCTGLLLPQVATEYGWDRETFLRHTCVKAGLPEDAWRRDAEVLCFSAEVFGGEAETKG